MNGSIYVIGGSSATGLNDVWKFDGTDWSQVAAGAGSRFSARDGHVSYVYNGKLWVAGGYDYAAHARVDDVWSSSDGSTWTQVTQVNVFPTRSESSGIVFDNRMWMIGGVDAGNYADAWYSVDGANWYNACTAPAEFSGRHSHTALVFNNRLWVIGGTGATGVGNSVYYAKNGE